MSNQKTFVTIVYASIIVLTTMIACMLFWEYRYFQKEARELAQVKEAYYQHVEMLKRSLNASMEPSEQEDQELDGEKKKITSSDEYVVIDYTDDAIAEEEPSQFQVISQEEEDRLKAIKSNIKQLTLPPVVKHKKISKKALRKSFKRSTRYAPVRDFVFSWPIDLQSFWLSSLFGPRKRPSGRVEFHHAIDMAAVRGTPVKAAAAGRVILAQSHAGFGNCIMIEHNNRYKTRYAHLHRIRVQPGQIVEEGEIIGTVGATGNVRGKGDGSHLHFEIHQDGHRVNPLIFLFG